MDGGGESGGWSKQKRRSLKLANQERKKAVMPTRGAVEMVRGR